MERRLDSGPATHPILAETVRELRDRRELPQRSKASR
jgi:hypothetical protein